MQVFEHCAQNYGGRACSGSNLDAAEERLLQKLVPRADVEKEEVRRRVEVALQACEDLGFRLVDLVGNEALGGDRRDYNGPGFLYLCSDFKRSRTHGMRFKVGSTNNVQRRMRTFRTANPDMQLVAACGSLFV